MRKHCCFSFSDGAECVELAVANIGERWYCAEHYDTWIEYYRRALNNGSCNLNAEDYASVRRILKESR